MAQKKGARGLHSHGSGLLPLFREGRDEILILPPIPRTKPAMTGTGPDFHLYEYSQRCRGGQSASLGIDDCESLREPHQLSLPDELRQGRAGADLAAKGLFPRPAGSSSGGSGFSTPWPHQWDRTKERSGLRTRQDLVLKMKEMKFNDGKKQNRRL